MCLNMSELCSWVIISGCMCSSCVANYGSLPNFWIDEVKSVKTEFPAWPLECLPPASSTISRLWRKSPKGSCSRWILLASYLSSFQFPAQPWRAWAATKHGLGTRHLQHLDIGSHCSPNYSNGMCQYSKGMYSTGAFWCLEQKWVQRFNLISWVCPLCFHPQRSCVQLAWCSSRTSAMGKLIINHQIFRGSQFSGTPSSPSSPSASELLILIVDMSRSWE